MARTSLFSWLFRRSLEDREARNDFIEFDRYGKARFDVAGYLASDEGGEMLKSISEANKKSAKQAA